MPAQWPTFINNFSSKLASRSFDKPEDIAVYLANQYFNTVKTSQTPFGNIHQSGQKSILEEGFKRAFKKLYESTAPTLDDKMKDILFADMEEELPNPEINFPVDEELRKCVKEMNTKDFIYYEFYPAAEKPVVKNIKGSSTTNLDNTTEHEIIFQAFGGKAPYIFTYNINGTLNKKVTSKSDTFSIIPDISTPGSFQYTLTSMKDADGIITDIDQSVTLVVPENSVEEIKITETISNVNPIFRTLEEIGKDPILLKKREDDIVELLSKKVFLQNNNSEEFRLWLDRLSLGNNSSIGKKVEKRVKDWIKSGKKIENNLNKKIFQDEHQSDKKNIPSFLTDDIIIKFTYDPNIDSLKRVEHLAVILTAAATRLFLNRSSSQKMNRWKVEREEFRNIKIACVNKHADAWKNKEESADENDPYELMGKAVLDYWKSCAAQPFSSAPPVPPTMIPTPGNYIPVYYGSQKSLSNNLRRAFNTGKRFKGDPTLQPATKLVATAVAVSFAKHLAELKFIYVGQIYVGVSTAPMIGFVPLAF